MDGDAPARPRVRGTVAGRRAAVVLVCFVVAATAGVLLATALGSQRYVLLTPLHTWLARAVVVTFGPLLLGVAWFLWTRGRRATITCVATTVLVQIAGCLAGAGAMVLSNLGAERSLDGPMVFAVSPRGGFELVWRVHPVVIWPGRFETVRVRTRAGPASRESVEDLVECSNSNVGRWPSTNPPTLATTGQVSFVDETTIGIDSGASMRLVRFDAGTLDVDHTVLLQYCPSAFATPPS